MKNKLIAVMAAFLMSASFFVFPVNAKANSEETTPPSTTEIQGTQEETETSKENENALTPDGNMTLVDDISSTTDSNKQHSLCKCLDKDIPFLSIIFCTTKVRVDKLEEDLSRRGYNCAKIHSDVKQSKRERIMKSFRNADIQYLIATDVAARGIDVTGVTHIYNYDIPETVESYIHRIGRCGRAGEKGYTCLFIDPKNQSMLEEIENTIKFNIPKRQLID